MRTAAIAYMTLSTQNEYPGRLIISPFRICNANWRYSNLHLESMSSFLVIVFWLSAVFQVASSFPQPIIPAAPGQADSAAALNLVLPVNLSSSSPQLIEPSAPGENPVPWNETFVPASTILTGPRPPARRHRCHCDGTRYGENLNGPGCLQAWARIPLLDRELSFGPRPAGYIFTEYDVNLPIRYLSRT